MVDFKNLAKPLILDGATGTGLQKRGMPAGACSEQWVLEHPEALIDLQRGYAAAGADAVLAPTFGANRSALGRHGLQDKVAEYNRRLVALSREAVGPDVLVAGDLAPGGLAMGGVDHLLFEELVAVFTEQAKALEEAGVDFFVVETQMSLAEARATVLAVQSVSTKPILVSFTLAEGGRSFAGGSVPAALLSLQELGIDAFGLNCVSDPALLQGTLRELSRFTVLPLSAKPNAGAPKYRDGKAYYDAPAAEMAAPVAGYVAAGARILGGCCGTDDTHLAAIRAAACDAMEKLPPAPEEKAAGEWYCSEYELLQFVPAGETDATPVAEVPVDENFEDRAEEAAEQADMLFLELGSMEQVNTVLDAQFTVRTPLWVSCATPELRSAFTRGYNGKAKYE